ncbi:unnamed protein product [Laminaria digitata]
MVVAMLMIVVIVLLADGTTAQVIRGRWQMTMVDGFAGHDYCYDNCFDFDYVVGLFAASGEPKHILAEQVLIGGQHRQFIPLFSFFYMKKSEGGILYFLEFGDT